MTSEKDEQKQILFVALKKDARPVLGDLRGAGHRVSLVEDIDEAQALLGSGGFQHAILPAPVLGALLEKHAALDSTEVESWRRSVSAIAFDIENLLVALGANLPDLGGLPESAASDTRQTIAALCDFLRDLTSELAAPSVGELRLKEIDLESAIETAAMTAYPSAAERRQRLVIDVDDSVASVRADDIKLKRMLSALLTYASNQTPRQGSVGVHAYQEREEPVICISYTGEEMTKTELRRLFSPSAGEDGPGGLARVQLLAGQHECRVWLESQRGSGVSLFLALPGWSNARSSRVASPAYQ